jgi:hypothetical protein
MSSASSARPTSRSPASSTSTAKALSARVYTEFQTDRHVVESGIPFEPGLPVELAWDYGLDMTAVVVLQEHVRAARDRLLRMGDLVGTTATPDLVAAALRAYLVELGVEERLTTPLWTLSCSATATRPATTGR